MSSMQKYKKKNTRLRLFLHLVQSVSIVKLLFSIIFFFSRMCDTCFLLVFASYKYFPVMWCVLIKHHKALNSQVFLDMYTYMWHVHECIRHIFTSKESNNETCWWTKLFIFKFNSIQFSSWSSNFNSSFKEFQKKISVEISFVDVYRKSLWLINVCVRTVSYIKRHKVCIFCQHRYLMLKINIFNT